MAHFRDNIKCSKPVTKQVTTEGKGGIEKIQPSF